MFKPALYLSLIICLLLSSLAFAQDEPNDYEIALERIEEARVNEAASIYFYDLELSSLPPEIGQLTNLENLSLYGNNLTSLPPEIGQLSNLTSLNVSDNQLSSLPPEIGRLTNLRYLYASYNQLSSLPSEIGQVINLRTLDVSDNQLSSLPLQLDQLIYLENLYLDNNSLSELPAEIGSLSNLGALYLSYNRLASLPGEIGQLSNLVDFSLGNNRLSSLPSTIGQLGNLRYLDLSSNVLSTLPAEIGLLTNLEELYLDGNNLTSLPPEIGNLNNLYSLSLEANPLTALPAELDNLSTVYGISFDENQANLFTPEVRNLQAGNQTITADLSLTQPIIHFVFSGEAGKSILLSLESDEFDTYLILLDANGNEITRNDDMTGRGTNSEIGALQLPYTGEYTAVVSSYSFITETDTLQGRFIFRLLWIDDTVVEATEAPVEATAEVTAEVTPELAGCTYGSYIAPECPESQIQTAASVQNFEYGRMVWLQVDGSISVFFNNGTYLSGLFGGDGSALPEVTEVPDGLVQPQLGFGYVWLNTAGVRDGLGWATGSENYYTATYEQLGEESASSQYAYLSMPDGSSIWLQPYTHTWGGN